MFLVKPSFEIWKMDDISQLAWAGRVCYKSEYKVDGLTAGEIYLKNGELIRNLIKQGHESVIEHAGATVKIICDRGVTHEIVRHRLCAFSQESTRYCDYKGGVAFVIPPWLPMIPSGEYKTYQDFDTELWNLLLQTGGQHWVSAMFMAESNYQQLRHWKWTPQQARSVLPNSLKTEIVMTANYREWRHIFKLRTSKAAHPQMREIMNPLLEEFKKRCTMLFEDIEHGGE